jgi:hypothetical protein
MSQTPIFDQIAAKYPADEPTIEIPVMDKRRRHKLYRNTERVLRNAGFTTRQ